MLRSDIRNVAIVARVDHGKTTLVDAVLGTRRAQLVGQHAEGRARAIDVELGTLEQFLGDQEARA